MDRSNNFSFIRFVTTDYAALISGVVAIWVGILIGWDYLREGVVPEHTRDVLILAGIALITFAWRFFRFASLFTHGLRTEAVIEDNTFDRSRSLLKFSYIHQGQHYNKINVVVKNKRSKALQPGDQITIYVDRNNPKKAHIWDLYQR